MVRLRILVAACSLILICAASNATADGKAVIQIYYDFLSNPASEEHATASKAATAESWESISNYLSTNKKRD